MPTEASEPNKPKRMTDDDIQREVLAEIKSAEDGRGTQVAKRESAWDRYYGRKLGNEKKGRSQFITRDVMDTIEWMMPFFMKTFAAGDPKIQIDIKGQEPYIGKALMDKIQIDLAEGPPGIFTLMYQWFKDSLVSNTAFTKLGWTLDEKIITVDFDDLSRPNLIQLLNDPDVQVDKIEETNGPFMVPTYRVTARVKKIIRDIVYAENTPNWEFLVSKKARDINDEYGKGQQTEVTLDYLKRINRAMSEKGKPYFKHLNELEAASGKSELAASNALEGEKSSYMADDEPIDDSINPETGAKTPVVLKEWYTRLDVDGDGYLEDIVCFLGNDKLIRHEINEEEFIPFSAIRPIIDCYKFNGIAFAELLIEIQNLKTMLFRRILDMFDFQVSGRWRIDPDGSVDLYALYNHTPGGAIPGKQGSIEDISPQPFNPGNLAILEYVEGLKEGRTGVTRYNQGMQADTLNKMLDINTLVPMADGSYKTMATIKTGDRIIGHDGHATLVIDAHPISIPKKAYRLTFASGESVIACADHLWRVQSPNDIRYNKWQIVNTEFLAKHGTHRKKTIQWYIPRVLRPYFDDNPSTNLPLDPYILGVWLGDGHSHGARFTISDEYILNRIKEWAIKTDHNVIEDTYQNSGKAKTYSVTKQNKADKKTGRFVGNGSLHTILKKTKLLKRYNGEKHIPEEYFKASYENRLELLRGLMDTDGCHHSNALVIFTQKKGQLSDDVLRLIESLGGWPNECNTEPGDWALEENKYVNLNFTLPDNPFNTPEKAKKFIPSRRCQERQAIVSIDRVISCPMRCLTVDDENGVYCIGKRFTVTHNTATGIVQIQSAAMQRMELVARIFAEGLVDFYKKIVKLYQRYLRKPFTAKVHGQDMEVAPEMIQGRVVCTVNMGIQASVGMEEAQKIERMLGILFKVNELYPGLLTPQKVHNLCRRYITSMGFKQVDDFITNLQEYMQEIQKMQQAQGQAQQVQQQMIAMQQKLAEMETMIKKQEADTKQKKVELDAQLQAKELTQDFVIDKEEIAQKERDSLRDFQVAIANALKPAPATQQGTNR